MLQDNFRLFPFRRVLQDKVLARRNVILGARVNYGIQHQVKGSQIYVFFGCGSFQKVFLRIGQHLIDRLLLLHHQGRVLGLQVLLRLLNLFSERILLTA